MRPLAYARAATRLWRVQRDLARIGFARCVERWLALDIDGAAPADADALRLARFLHRLGRRMRGSRCLDQSLALTSLLRQGGYAAALVIGAERHGRDVGAHAWVEIGGCALDEAGIPRARLRVLETWPKIA